MYIHLKANTKALWLFEYLTNTSSCRNARGSGETRSWSRHLWRRPPNQEQPREHLAEPQEHQNQVQYYTPHIASRTSAWQRRMCNTFPEIHLWCNTCWPLGGKHGSRAVLFRIPVSKHWWSLNPGCIMSSLLHMCETRQANFQILVTRQISLCAHRPWYRLRWPIAYYRTTTKMVNFTWLSSYCKQTFERLPFTL